jgi:hypothetical protein
MVISAQVVRVTINGPYSYTLYKDGIGEKVVVGLATPQAAWNAVRDDVVAFVTAALPVVETVVRMNINVSTTQTP